jgi:malate/lactate dehydrogenase
MMHKYYKDETVKCIENPLDNMAWIKWKLTKGNYKENIGTLIDASKAVCLEINVEKTK